MADRIYSPGEVAAIIERTAEHQRRAAEPAGPDGLTLAEIEHACRAAGLDPAFVREAASEVEAAGPALDGGSSVTSVAEHWADGPASPEAWEDAVDQLRVRFGPSMARGNAGGPRPVGAGWEWTHQTLGGLQRTVSVSPRGGRTRVRVVAVGSGLADTRTQGVLTGAVLGLAPAMLLGALLAEGLGLGDVIGVASLVVVLLASVVLGGLVLAPRIRRSREQQARDTQRLAEEVAQWVSPSGTEALEATPVASPEGADAPISPPRLALDLDEPAGAEAPSAPRTRVR